MFRKKAGSEGDSNTRDVAFLKDLAPSYQPESHHDYVEWISHAIDKNPAVSNIALAGTYGAGKSSILSEVARRYPKRIIQLSLLTLGKRDPALAAASPENQPPAESITNRIQKEVVKQLLYQQSPTKAPASRFRRIGRFRWGHELLIACIFGAVAASLAFVVGLDVSLTPELSLIISGRPHAVPYFGLLLLVGLLGGAVAIAVRSLARGRIGIERVTAGPATISLPERSTSYFDEYLDEIIYFFENNSKRDIVVIEDLDRFDDPYIFESLRSLNGLLNSAEQLKGRHFRFVYAMKDSVFEKLGRDGGDVEDEARADLVRANRTKFFELVIPVIPFVTHKNAADVMLKSLGERNLTVSRELIALAARHLADMRLIHNTINEYAVFKAKLLDVKDPVPELTAETLFAMIMFKNAHPGHFENIRHGTSCLDDLFAIWRLFVSANSQRIREENRALRVKIANRSAGSAYAADLGATVLKQVAALYSAPGTGLADPAISYEGYEVGAEKLCDPEFWQRFIEDNGALVVQTHMPGYSYGTQSMQMQRGTLEALTGMSLDPANFKNDPRADKAQADLTHNEALIERLQRASWKDLAGMPDLRYQPEGVEAASNFREHIVAALPSRLAVDLVLNGYITSYFMLHVSSFYGALIRPRAMTYVMRFVDNGKNDSDFILDADDAAAILQDQGTGIVREVSILNVGLVNHVLAKVPLQANVLAQTVAATPAGSEFFDRYLEAGTEKLKLVSEVTPLMDDIFARLASSESLLPGARMEMIGAAIEASASDVDYEIPDGVKSLLESEYLRLEALTGVASQSLVDKVIDFFSKADAVVPSLGGLSDSAIAALRVSGGYAITRENLEAVTGGSDISLDSLLAAHENALKRVSQSPRPYADALREFGDGVASVRSASTLKSFLAVALKRDMEATRFVISRASASATQDRLLDVPARAWPALMRHHLARPTFENVAAYISHHEMVDDDLAHSLHGASAVVDIETASADERRQLALQIINAPSSQLTAEDRAQLASSLKPGQLDADDIAPRAGRLIGELLSHGILAPDEEAFSSRLMVDWDTQSYAIDAVSNFAEVLSTETLSAWFVEPLLRDPAKRALHFPVAKLLPAYDELPRAAWDAYLDAGLSENAPFTPGTTNLYQAALAGVDAGRLVSLLARNVERLDNDSLRRVLRELDYPWGKVADPGWGVTPIAESDDAKTVLEALQRAKVVSKMPVVNGEFRVTLRQPPK